MADELLTLARTLVSDLREVRTAAGRLTGLTGQNAAHQQVLSIAAGAAFESASRLESILEQQATSLDAVLAQISLPADLAQLETNIARDMQELKQRAAAMQSGRIDRQQVLDILTAFEQELSTERADAVKRAFGFFAIVTKAVLPLL